MYDHLGRTEKPTAGQVFDQSVPPVTFKVRTDFSDQGAWKAFCEAIRQPVGEFRADVEFVSDPAYDGFTVERLMRLVPKRFDHTFVFVADRTAMTHPEHPVLVVDLYEELGRTFRVIPSEMEG